MDNEFLGVKRPCRHDKDDDIEQMQEEFLKGRLKPSVQVIRKTTNELSASKERSGTKIEASSHIQLQPYSKDRDLAVDVPILGEIVEHDIVSGFSLPLPMSCSTGFPVLPSKSVPVKMKRREKSIFLNHVEASKEIMSEKHIEIIPSSGLVTLNPKETKSYIIDGSGLSDGISEAQRIHKENTDKMLSLSKEEILAQQQQLLKNLSPNTLEFLRSRRAKNSRFAKEPGSLNSFTNSRKNPETVDVTGTIAVGENLSGDPHEKVLKTSGDCAREGIILQHIQDFNSAGSEIAGGNEAIAVQACVGNVEKDFPVEELPIEPKEASKWLHMDKLEPDKLRWMTMLPKPVGSKSGFTARFDFQGKLVSRDEDISTLHGLHHHSDEPEVPGYSIEELFLLARSSFQSQRITALDALAHIFENYWDGRLDGCLDVPLLSVLLQSGLVPLLRWALDDTTLPSIAAAVLAMHRLLVCKADEMFLDWTFCWMNGHISPFLTAKDDDDLSEDNLEELTDAAIVKLDVIKGLLRMDILPRFQYILCVLHPPTSVCQLLVEIYIRIARHSYVSAKQVAEFPGLIDAVFQKFLPLDWKCNYQNTNAADCFCPLPSAMKLIRVIASAGKDLALNVLENYPLVDALKCCLPLDPSDKNLPHSDLQRLVIESFRTWQVFLNYQLCLEVYCDLCSHTFTLFQFCQSLHINSDTGENISNCQFAAHFFKAMEAYVIAFSEEDAESKNKLMKPCCLRTNNMPFLLEMSEICLQHWLWEFTNQDPNYNGTILLSACLNFVTVVYKKTAQFQPEFDSELSGSLRKTCLSYLLPCLLSSKFSAFLKKLSSYSLLLCTDRSGCERDSRTLVSLGCCMWKDDIVPLLKDNSVFPLVTSIASFIRVVAELDADLGKKLSDTILNQPSILDYLQNLSSTTSSFSHWFNKFEVEFVCHVIQLFASNIPKQNESFTLWYKVTLHLLTYITTPYELFAKRALQNIIFNPSLLSWIADKALTKEARSNSVDVIAWKDICKFYIETSMTNEDLENSCCLFMQRPSHLNSLSYEQRIVMKKGWSLSPIFNLYQISKTKDCGGVLFYDVVTTVKYCLQWVRKSSTFCSSAKDDVHVSVVFFHLCMVFLIDTEAFLNQEIRNLLSVCLHDILALKLNLDLENLKWKDTTDFNVIFQEMLLQFEAASYGDHLFANFVAIPLQQRYPAKWKKLVLTEHPQVVRFLGIPLKQLAVPIEEYLEPHEESTEILLEYFGILTSGELSNKRSPLLFLMAVHHLHHFLCGAGRENVEFQQMLLKRLKHVKIKEIADYIFQYAGPNLNSDLGFDLNGISAVEAASTR